MKSETSKGQALREARAALVRAKKALKTAKAEPTAASVEQILSELYRADMRLDYFENKRVGRPRLGLIQKAMRRDTTAPVRKVGRPTTTGGRGVDDMVDQQREALKAKGRKHGVTNATLALHDLYSNPLTKASPSMRARRLATVRNAYYAAKRARAKVD